MHVEPGVVHGAETAPGHATAAAAGAHALEARAHGVAPVPMRSAAALVLLEGPPHLPVGASEVHSILCATLLLVLGAAPAAGLAEGLAPSDPPTCAVALAAPPLPAIHALARIVPRDTPDVELRSREVPARSATCRGGVIAWVAFRAPHGPGPGAGTFAAVGVFGAARLVAVAVAPPAHPAVAEGARTGPVTPRPA